MIGKYSPSLLTFYSVCFAFLIVLFYSKSRSKILGFVMALGIILVGSEYWELPILVCGYLGLFGHSHHFLSVLNHAIAIFVFVILVSFSQIKLGRKHVYVLILGPLIVAPLILPSGMPQAIFYLARLIGLGILGGVFYFGFDKLN